MAVTITSNIDSWATKESATLDAAVGRWAVDTHNTAQRLAPHDTGDLENSGRVERKSSGRWTVTFGNSQVPYARRRHFENFANPQTLHYLQRAGDSNARNFVSRYLRGRR